MKSFCNLPPPCITLNIILNYSSIASWPLMPLFERNCKTSREGIIQRQHLHVTPITLDVYDSFMKRSPERLCNRVPKFMGP